MKKYFILNIGLMLFLIFIHISTVKASVLQDSIKPLTKINKQFLVVVHIVKDSNSIGISESYINAVMANINQIFKPIEASFTVCEFKYIDNYQYSYLAHDHPIDKREQELTPMFRLTNRINMYFIKEPDKIQQKTCGYASLGGIAGYGNIVIKKNCADASTIAHELGHYFGLSHTFEKSVPELVNGSNCKTAGDGFCDTPADPYDPAKKTSEYIDELSCAYISNVRDANGDLYYPDVSNIMGYYTTCVCLKFTYEQYNYMANYYNTHLGTW